MYPDVLMYFLLCILECGIEENVCYMSWRTVSYIHSAVLMDCLLCILLVVLVDFLLHILVCGISGFSAILVCFIDGLSYM
jgi:hypothetical protein